MCTACRSGKVVVKLCGICLIDYTGKDNVFTISSRCMHMINMQLCVPGFLVYSVCVCMHLCNLSDVQMFCTGGWKPITCTCEI